MGNWLKGVHGLSVSLCALLVGERVGGHRRISSIMVFPVFRSRQLLCKSLLDVKKLMVSEKQVAQIANGAGLICMHLSGDSLLLPAAEPQIQSMLRSLVLLPLPQLGWSLAQATSH